MRQICRWLSAVGMGLLVLFPGAPGVGAEEGGTLAQVRARGHLQCGVSEGLAGFSNPDDQGNWRGLDVALCRAVAAAVFGDAGAVRFTSLTAKVRFTALQSGEIDILARNTTYTLGRDVGQRLSFPAINFYDGQAFMIPRVLGITSAEELGGATVCVNQGTTTEQNVADFFRAHGMKYELVTFERSEETVTAYEAGRCDIYTTDASGLYAQRSKLADPDAHVVLPTLISREPLAPAVREGDDRWADIVRWTHFAMVTAEELGVTSANVDDMRASPNPEILRLLGREGDFGEQLGLAADWAYQIIKQVGNYGEVYAANVGADSPLAIERGLNALWRDGGLQYAPPMR